MVNRPLIRPAISGGGTLGGGWLTSHYKRKGSSANQHFSGASWLLVLGKVNNSRIQEFLPTQPDHQNPPSRGANGRKKS